MQPPDDADSQPTERPSAVELRRMGSNAGQTELSPEVAWYARACVLEWLSPDDAARTDAALARLVKVSKQTVGDIRKGGRNVGTNTAMKIAEWLGVSWEQFKSDATRAYKERGPGRELHVEREERYPNRKRALDLVRDEFDPEAVRRVESLDLHSARDPSPREWIERLEIEERNVKWEREHPDELAARRAADAARLRELVEAHARATGQAPPNDDAEEPPPEGSIAWREAQERRKK